MAITQEFLAKVVRGVATAVERCGYELLEVNEDPFTSNSADIVAVAPNGVIAAIDVRVGVGRFPDKPAAAVARERFESLLPTLGKKHGESIYRYDVICLNVDVEGGRAAVKRHENIAGASDVTNLEWLARFDPETLLAMIPDEGRVEWLRQVHGAHGADVTESQLA